MSFRCATCGQIHEGLPMDLAFAKPADYFLVPPDQRERRCAWTPDWCVIDERRFYIRGCLCVPVTDIEGTFVWGMWARVGVRSFERYFEHCEARTDGTNERPFRGRLSTEDRADYEGLDKHPVTIQMRTANERPAILLAESDHLLYREQRQGITLHRVGEILRTLFPGQFG